MEFEFELPGTFVRNDQLTQTLVWSILREFDQACFALGEYALSIQPEIHGGSPSLRESYFKRRQLESDIEHQLLQEKPELREKRDELYYLIEKTYRKQIRDAGAQSANHDSQKAIFFARSFVFSLDNLRSYLRILSRQPFAGLAEPFGQFDQLLPTLRDARNSAHHLDDRIQRKGAFDKQTRKHYEIEESMILDSVDDNGYITTLGDGSTTTIPVSAKILKDIQVIIESMFSHLHWEGPRSFHPQLQPC
jgi:hypothetical protein